MITSRPGKQNLLEVAEQLFTERGYHAVSIREIAQACGVTNAALYYHFPSKEALFDEVLSHHVGQLAARMTAAAAQASAPREQVIAMLYEYAAQVAERRSLLFSLRRHPETGHNPESYNRLIRHMFEPFEQTLQTAITRGELRPLPEGYSPAALLLGLFHGMLQHRKSCDSGEFQLSLEDVRLAVEIFWDGMKS